MYLNYLCLPAHVTGSSRRTEPKQVMFSDGIRPGGDLTELDGSSEVSRMHPRRSRAKKQSVGQGMETELY